MNDRRIVLHVAVVLWLAVYSVGAHEVYDGLRHWEMPSSDPDRVILT